MNDGRKRTKIVTGLRQRLARSNVGHNQIGNHVHWTDFVDRTTYSVSAHGVRDGCCLFSAVQEIAALQVCDVQRLELWPFGKVEVYQYRLVLRKFSLTPCLLSIRL